MVVIKKSGKKEEFAPGKIYQSIAGANDETDEPMNESDLKVVISDLRHIVEGKDQIDTFQIDVIVSGLLYTRGLMKTLKQYSNYRKKR